MKRLEFAFLLLFSALGCLWHSPAVAQKANYIFLDSNCYQPRIGDPTEVDTIYGSRKDQGLGGGLFGIGVAPGGSYQRLLIGGLQSDRSLVSLVETGPTFNLHNLTGTPTKISYDNFALIHPRSPQIIDLFYADPPTIFWADQAGNFDTSRYTVLARKLPDGTTAIPIDGSYAFLPLTSDSTDDIVFVSTPFFTPISYLVLFRGSSLVNQPKSILPDSAVVYDSASLAKYPLRTMVGDFRGTARKGMLMMETGRDNIFYYPNEKPFSLASLVQACHYDTLLAGWQNPGMSADPTNALTGVAMKALPKASWDKSDDFVSIFTQQDSVYIQHQGHSRRRIYFYRGGSTFGNVRRTLSDADYILLPPEAQDTFFIGIMTQTLRDCGDMTGTGNRVLQVIEGRDNLYEDVLFYVTGRALDDKVDLFYEAGPGIGSGADTLTADSDNLQDVIIAMPYHYSYEDLALGKTNVGSIQVVHGSKKIPVRLNDRFSVGVHRTAPDAIIAYPNPAHDRMTMECTFDHSGSTTIVIFDILGRELVHEIRRVSAGSNALTIDLKGLAPGVYELRADDHGRILRSQIVVR